MQKRNYSKGLLYEYTKVLSGQLPQMSNTFFRSGESENERTALQIIRFAVEVFLRWDPDDVYDHFDDSVIRIMKLENVYPFITFPPELCSDRDYWYIAKLLYPSQIRYDVDDLTLRTYKGVLLGKENGGLYRFPKGFFDDYTGRHRAYVCLRYLISRRVTVHSVKELYSFFASDAGKRLLDQNALSLIWKNVFTSPIIYLHEMLLEMSSEQADEFFFHYYEFQFRYREEIAERKRFEALEKKKKMEEQQNDAFLEKLGLV